VKVTTAQTDADISRCFPILRQLRPHLLEGKFLSAVRRQLAGGYILVFLEADNEIQSVAGYRYIDNLLSGRILYIDDLVTSDLARSRGWGKKLFEWLVDQARENGCQALELDSGVQRFEAHRFYLANRMVISSHHFRLTL
jgi:GNAT superfamily N-acetyltransferase